MFDLTGKTAVVTGGAKGIGAATARLLGKAGAKVHVLDIESGCDVTDEGQVKAAFEKIRDIDILVNNAGRAARKPAVELSAQDWDDVIALNLTAVFRCSKNVFPHMKRRGGGSIVNLASIMGLSGGIYPNASYQASKGGVVNLTRALALEWAADNVRVNAVAPTFVRTDLTLADLLRPGKAEDGSVAHAARPASRAGGESPPRLSTCAARRRRASPASSFPWIPATWRDESKTANWLAILAMALNALWPLIAQARPTTRVPVCAVGEVTHFIEVPVGGDATAA
jgi:NAD(P)-dependent dehydrogenase (short-subunit alcohol dehydrogenase family)